LERNNPLIVTATPPRSEYRGGSRDRRPCGVLWSGDHRGGGKGKAAGVIAKGEGDVRGERRKYEALDLPGGRECNVHIAAVVRDGDAGRLTREGLRGCYRALKADR